MKAFVFPGQGAQFPGMGKDLYETYDEAKEMFLQANHLLDFNITDIMFGDDSEALKETKITQNKLLESIHSTFPTATVLFIPIHPFFKEKNFFIPSNLSSSKIQLYSWWENPKKFAQDYLVKDGIHLNAQGHTLLGQNLAHQLTVNI